MTKQTHTPSYTPGPWKLEIGLDTSTSRGRRAGKIQILTKDNFCIGEWKGQRPAIVEDKYNAQLISSAPEMLRVLLDCRARIVELTEMAYSSEEASYMSLEKIDSVIAKATGIVNEKMD